MDSQPSIIVAAAMGGAAFLIAVIRILRRRLDIRRRQWWFDAADAVFATSAAALLIGTFALPSILQEATVVFRWTVFAFMCWSVCEEVLEARREHTTPESFLWQDRGR